MTARELLQGACDLHVHAGPSLFARVVDAFQTAEQARDAGMKAVVLKNHHEESMGKATLVNQKIEGINVYGSLVLNYASGGLNPFAVDSAIKLGAKIIFMPTIDARNHIQFYGVGQYGNKMKLQTSLPKVYHTATGISILKEDKIEPAVLEILEIIAETDVVLATSHLSLPEVKVLITEAKEVGVKKIIINHVNFEVTNIPIKEQIELIEPGVFLEHTFMSMLPPWHCINIDQMVERIRSVGVNQCILSTDCGKLAGPTPVDGLRIFYQLLLEYGMTDKEIEVMGHINPSKILNL